jgi:hypothetical protein
LRHGCFCAHPLMAHLLNIDSAQADKLNRSLRRGEPVTKPGALRASMGLGTSAADIDHLFAALTSIVIDGPRWSYQCAPDGGDYWPEPDPRPRPQWAEPRQRILGPTHG